MIGNVSSDLGIHILEGEDDSETPIEQWLLLPQRSTEVTFIPYDDGKIGSQKQIRATRKQVLNYGLYI